MTRITGSECAVMCYLIITHSPKKRHKSCGCDVGNGGDLGGWKEKNT